MVILMVCIGFSAYHHEGEQDADEFLAAHPNKAGTKLDHCALCHSGGQYERRPGQFVSLGSCQWCHHTYGYDGSGNIIDTINDYGMDYLANGRDRDAIEAIENFDSDGDGFTNIAEIEDNRFPGNPDDDPSKVVAPYRVYTKAQLEAMTQHTQFLLLNTSRSGDFYAEYSGVAVEDLLEDAGISDTATGITVYAPDGWSQYHPLEVDPDPEFYHVYGTYDQAAYQYDPQADIALNPVDGWCDYSAPSCQGRNHSDPIVNPNGNKMILAFKRDGAYMDPGILNIDNKLDGEGPFRVVPPQKTPSPPDQSSRSENQNVLWPYDYDWDHNAGAATRSVTIIKVEPLPPGTTDIDILEAGWDYVDGEKIVVYGAISRFGSGDYDYCVPYFSSRSNHWTGLALKNMSASENANVAGIIFDENGTMISNVVDRLIMAKGQEAFLVGQGLSQEGWTKINSDQPLVGLCFVGNGMTYMADIDLISNLSTNLCIPHITQNNSWDMKIHICNPNNNDATVSISVIDTQGNTVYTQQYTLPANGSRAYPMSDILQGSIEQEGSIEISATQEIAGFAICDNLKTGGNCYAGIDAVALDEQ